MTESPLISLHWIDSKQLSLLDNGSVVQDRIISSIECSKTTKPLLHASRENLRHEYEWWTRSAVDDTEQTDSAVKLLTTLLPLVVTSLSKSQSRWVIAITMSIALHAYQLHAYLSSTSIKLCATRILLPSSKRHASERLTRRSALRHRTCMYSICLAYIREPTIARNPAMPSTKTVTCFHHGVARVAI
jgi:hypothetical protein